MSVAADLMASLSARLTAALPGYAVKVRKTGGRVEGDPAELVVLSLGADERRPAYGHPGIGLWVAYPVAVALSRPNPPAVGGLSLTDARETAVKVLMDLQAIRTAAPNPVAALDRLGFTGRPFYGSAAAGKGFDWLAFQVTYTLRESRV